jgi:hypothetical protein
VSLLNIFINIDNQKITFAKINIGM